MANKYLDMPVGIYENARASLVRHRDGSVTVIFPTVAWDGNTGCLAFKRIRFKGRDAEKAKRVFDGREAVEYGDGEKYQMGVAEFLASYV